MRALASALATGVVALALAAQAGACSTGDPAWSPDGRSIAFAGSSDANTPWTIKLVDSAGTEIRDVTAKPPDDPPFLVWSHDFEPTWSPDGWQLAYDRGWLTYSPGDSHSFDSLVISVQDLSSGTVAAVGNGLDPQWSSVGELAWSTLGFPYNDPSGFVAGALTVTGDGGDPSWSPTGRRIAYDQHVWIWIRRADGRGRRRRLTKGLDPHWSPDGRWIAFFRENTPDTLRFIGPQARQPSRSLSVERGSDVEPVWSPDGSRIALGTSILNVRTGRVRELDAQLGLYPGPSWSPDGKQLVYASDTLTIVRLSDGTSRTIDPCALPVAG
jgi:Tol biopolymer transport system component